MSLGMKLAMTIWNGRIAPLFDVARHLLICETEGFGRNVTVLESIGLQEDTPERRIAALSAMGISAVICGGISREYEEALAYAGIEMDTFVAGEVSDVIAAWESGTLRQRRYSMPGCNCPRHRYMHRRERKGCRNPRGGRRHNR